MERKVNVIEDLDGKKIVFIHDIRFKGKNIVWNDVEKYLHDVMEIKKKRANPVRHKPYPVKTHFLIYNNLRKRFRQ